MLWTYLPIILHVLKLGLHQFETLFEIFDLFFQFAFFLLQLFLLLIDQRIDARQTAFFVLAAVVAAGVLLLGVGRRGVDVRDEEFLAVRGGSVDVIGGRRGGFGGGAQRRRFGRMSQFDEVLNFLFKGFILRLQFLNFFRLVRLDGDYFHNLILDIIEFAFQILAVLFQLEHLHFGLLLMLLLLIGAICDQGRPGPFQRGVGDDRQRFRLLRKWMLMVMKRG